MSKRNLIFIIIAFALFLFCFFVIGPLLQTEMEKHMPYLIVDPERRAETGCQYDYLTYIPIELTGAKEGIVFPVSRVSEDMLPYIHYPDTWEHPLNPFNPANQFSQTIYWTLITLVVILGVAIVVYLIILWRKGVLKKIKEKYSDKDE